MFFGLFRIVFYVNCNLNVLVYCFFLFLFVNRIYKDVSECIWNKV